jgi:hypothetical protein
VPLDPLKYYPPPPQSGGGVIARSRTALFLTGLPAPGSRIRKRAESAGGPASSAGTTFTQSLSGSVTLTGVLVGKALKALTGAVTSAGTLTKQTQTTKTGVVTPTGVLTKQDRPANLTGAVTPSGTLVKRTNKPLVGGVTPSGALVGKALKALVGAVTPTGVLTKLVLLANKTGTVTLTGVLAKAFVKSLTGSVTLSGSFLARANKALTGTVTLTGSLTKKTIRALTGSVTLSGSLSAIKLFVKTLIGGTVTLSATLVKLTKPANLTGSVTPSGILTKQDRPANKTSSVTLSGVLTPIRLFAKALTGSVTPSGALVRRTNKSLIGSVTPSGVLNDQTRRSLIGSITPSGALTKQARKSLAGGVTLAGVLSRQPLRSLTGLLTLDGILTKRAYKILVGLVSLAGVLTPLLLPGGVLTRGIRMFFSWLFRSRTVKSLLVEAMNVRTGQVVTDEFTTRRFDTGVSANADTLPTAVLVKNGVDQADVVTITNVGTGRYKFAVTMPTIAYGDVVSVVVTAIVNAVTDRDVIWRGSSYVPLDQLSAGARTVTVTVNDGTNPIVGASVRMTKGVENYVVVTGTGGIAVFNLNDGTWVVSIALSGYSFAGANLVVNADVSPTYSMVPVTLTPSVAGKTTAYLTCYDQNGDAEPGVSFTIKVFATGPAVYGAGYDNTERVAVSDSNGLVEFVNTFKGVTYQVWRGTGSVKYTVKIPSTAGTTFELPSIIGD